jgi:hypothetical protein
MSKGESSARKTAIFYRIYGKANTEQDNLANDFFSTKNKNIIIFFFYFPFADWSSMSKRTKVEICNDY